MIEKHCKDEHGEIRVKAGDLNERMSNLHELVYHYLENRKVLFLTDDGNYVVSNGVERLKF